MQGSSVNSEQTACIPTLACPPPLNPPTPPPTSPPTMDPSSLSQCKAGTYWDVNDYSNGCKKCPSDQYSLAGAYGCLQCLMWYDKPNADQSGCAQYYPTPPPTRSPTPAPSRPPTPAPTRYPTPTPPRYPTPTPTRYPTPKPTPLPSLSPNIPRPLTPSQCKAGTYWDVYDSSNGCKECPFQSYSLDGEYECLECPGFAWPNANKSGCVSYWYIVATPPPSCAPTFSRPLTPSQCKAGTYWDVNDYSYGCKKCPSDQYSLAGAYECLYCPCPGSLWPTADQSGCRNRWDPNRIVVTPPPTLPPAPRL